MADYEDEIIKVPRFSEENGFYTTKQRSLLMAKIKSKHTAPELMLRKSLWALGFRYRLHNKALPGKPDIVFKKFKLAIFIDGEFWHGYQWEKKRDQIKTNRAFWVPKIERNMQRDNSNNHQLHAMGFTVMRFWEQQVKKELDHCINTIEHYLNQVNEGGSF